jgi:hypothetical protein
MMIPNRSNLLPCEMWHEIAPGTDIWKAAEQLSALAKFTGKIVCTEFDAVPLGIAPGVTPKMVIEHWEFLWPVFHPEDKA